MTPETIGDTDTIAEEGHIGVRDIPQFVAEPFVAHTSESIAPEAVHEVSTVEQDEVQTTQLETEGIANPPVVEAPAEEDSPIFETFVTDDGQPTQADAPETKDKIQGTGTLEAAVTEVSHHFSFGTCTDLESSRHLHHC